MKPRQEGKVCCLLKALYGLKQAGRVWHQELMKVLVTDLGFKQSAVDHSIFLRQTVDKHSIVAVATDDMAVTSKRTANVERFKSELRQYWEISDKGELSWFLGFEVKCDSTVRTISINQRAYIEAMLSKFRMQSRFRHRWRQARNTQKSKALRHQHKRGACVGCHIWKQLVASCGRL